MKDVNHLMKSSRSI